MFCPLILIAIEMRVGTYGIVQPIVKLTGAA